MNNNATKFIEAGFVKATENTSKPLSAVCVCVCGGGVTEVRLTKAQPVISDPHESTSQQPRNLTLHFCFSST